jgi:hypothetical protein
MGSLDWIVLAGVCECCVELSGWIKCGEFLDYLVRRFLRANNHDVCGYRTYVSVCP